MLGRCRRPALAACLVFAAVGCTIRQDIDPVDATTTIEKVYIQNNSRVLMSGLVDEIEEQVRQLGFDAEVYQYGLPDDAVHHLTYTANWRWDFAMTLVYFRASLHEHGERIGRVEYDARDGFGNFRRYGQTGEKIRPLLVQLFEDVARTPTDP